MEAFDHLKKVDQSFLRDFFFLLSSCLCRFLRAHVVKLLETYLELKRDLQKVIRHMSSRNRHKFNGFFSFEEPKKASTLSLT